MTRRGANQPFLSAAILAALLGALNAKAQGGAPTPSSGAETFVADAINVEHVIGRLLLRTSDRADIAVTIDPGTVTIDPPQATAARGRLSIEGARGYRHGACRTRNDVVEVRVRGGVYAPIDAYPVITIDAPAGVALSLAGGVVFGQIDPVGPAEVRLDSCGDVAITAITGQADLTVNGKGALSVGALGPASAAINGGGDITLGPVTGDATLEVNGSGDLRVARLDGELEALVRGSGDIIVEAGLASAFEAAVYGSGAVRFGGMAIDPRLAIYGAGDIRITAFEGSVRSTGSGSGQVRLGE